MDKNFINVDLDDPKTALVAEALSNKTCVKILSLLAEHELTASDVATRLGIPLNTTGYNIDKLIHSGLVEKSSNFFWSVKGKKTVVYKVANKKIIITPKRSIKGVIPAAIISGIFAILLKTLLVTKETGVVETMLPASKDAGVLIATEAGSSAAAGASAAASNVSLLSVGWIWFIAGALFSLIIASLWDWFSYKRSLK